MFPRRIMPLPLFLIASGILCPSAMASLAAAPPAQSEIQALALPVSTAPKTAIACAKTLETHRTSAEKSLRLRAHDSRVFPRRLPPLATAPLAAPVFRLVVAEAQTAPSTPVAPAQIPPAPIPPATPSTPAPAAPVIAAPSTPAILRDASGQPLVTNVFVETDLKQALSDISTQTGVPIIADNTVQGTVSADLKDVPLERALEMLLQTGGFALAKMDGYYLAGMPDPANPNFYLLSQTEVVELNYIAPRVVLDLLAIPYGRYLSAENFAPTITEPARDGSSGQSSVRRSVGSGSGSLQRLGVSSPSVNLPPESDRISITAPPQLIARIKADIARLDRPRTQVMLEAVVLEISEEALKDIGLNFTTRFLGASLLSGGANISYSAIKGNETAQLTALVRSGTARLRANPRVSTAEGQTAEIEVGRESYFEIDTGNNNLSYSTLEVIKSGILLRITPKVLEATGEVMARIEPEVRDVTGRSSNGLPEITFRRAATNLRVRDGESIVIGGLINEFSSRSNSKIPILGDLPLVGKIFRGVNERKTKSEVVIIITPRILVDAEMNDEIRSPVLQNDLDAFREGALWSPFAFPAKKK